MEEAVKHIVFVSGLCLAAAGCASPQQATGTAAGATAGAIVGGPVGAVVGAGIGAAATAPTGPGQLAGLPPGTCYVADRAGNIRVDRTGRPLTTRC
jgi:hypothetical protein